jgi:hypothetical protein
VHPRRELGIRELRDPLVIPAENEMRSSERSKVVVWNTSSAQIICIQVVPHFGGVLMMMSPGRSTKPSQRALSLTIIV